MIKKHRRLVVSTLLLLGLLDPLPARVQMENLSRGIVAVRQADDSVFVSWRLFGTDPEGTAFNLYRRLDDASPQRVNANPITGATNTIDRTAPRTGTLQYTVCPVLNGREWPASRPASVWDNPYLAIPIQPVPGYRPGDAALADLDGDGDYEIVLHQVSRGRDNSFAGLTNPPILDAYELDGTHMWRVNLGINIREGEHYTQFMVYDLDGDGKAEMVCKTADGTVDGQGRVVGDRERDWRVQREGHITHGRILSGPEYLTVFDGLSGAALETVTYRPGRDPIDGWGGIGGNGGNDGYGNRVDRFLACVANLDGIRPSVVMCRGVYGRIVMVAWDWRGGRLHHRWTFDSGIDYPPYDDASPYSGMGGHSLAVADVDDDGRDEIVYHAMVVDDDGRGLYSTGLRHGYAMHISDMVPNRAGLEVFTIHENEGRTVRFQTPGVALRDARSGVILWQHSPGTDVGGGMAADIDPRFHGYEFWGGPGGLRDTASREIGPSPATTGWALWWDGDLLRELLSGTSVKKWDWERGEERTLVTLPSPGRVRNPCLLGDMIGDWREELLLPSADGRGLCLYTTTLPTEHRLYTLMHDPQYRLSMVWQNVVYNKPPHPSFYLGNRMAAPPRPDITLVGAGEAIAGVPSP